MTDKTKEELMSEYRGLKAAAEIACAKRNEILEAFEKADNERNELVYRLDRMRSALRVLGIEVDAEKSAR